MDIVFISRKNMFEKIGGDTIQLLKTKEYLERMYKINIRICLDLSEIDMIKSSDLVHIFNIQNADYTLEAINLCKKLGKKTVLSTIFWDLRSASYVNFAYKILKVTPSLLLYRTKFIGEFGIRLAYKVIKNKKNIMYNKRKIAKKILIEADYILPNSNEELNLLAKFYNVSEDLLAKKSRVIPNAIDMDNLKNELNHNSLIQCKDYILQVGRIEPIKNQISLVKALEDIKEVPIVFIGRIGDQSYFEKLKKIADKRGNVFFIEEVENDAVYNYYRNAKCHVLPSFRESPGLASLEALASGIPIVVSEKKYCPITYYKFDLYGYTCNPFSVNSIKVAVMKAYNGGVKLEPPLNFIQDFTYAKAAEETYKAYKTITGQEDLYD